MYSADACGMRYLYVLTYILTYICMYLLIYLYIDMYMYMTDETHSIVNR